MVPDPFTAEVLSTHSRVVNLLLPEGLLVSLVRDSEDMTALSIEVPELPTGDAASGAFSQGAFSRRGTVIRSASLTVSLGTERRFTGKPLAGGFPERLGESLRAAILRLSGDDGFASVLSKPRNVFARKAAEILAEGLAGLPKLLGLGIGFTPSGDDFLTGYLMASDLRGASAGGLRRSIEERLAGTTPGGRTLLYLAVRKSYPCYLLRFWRGLRLVDGTRISATTVSEAVRGARTHGETSGLDAVAGFAWFLLTRRG